MSASNLSAVQIAVEHGFGTHADERVTELSPNHIYYYWDIRGKHDTNLSYYAAIQDGFVAAAGGGKGSVMILVYKRVVDACVDLRRTIQSVFERIRATRQRRQQDEELLSWRDSIQSITLMGIRQRFPSQKSKTPIQTPIQFTAQNSETVFRARNNRHYWRSGAVSFGDIVEERLAYTVVMRLPLRMETFRFLFDDHYVGIEHQSGKSVEKGLASPHESEGEQGYESDSAAMESALVTRRRQIHHVPQLLAQGLARYEDMGSYSYRMHERDWNNGGRLANPKSAPIVTLFPRLLDDVNTDNTEISWFFPERYVAQEQLLNQDRIVRMRRGELELDQCVQVTTTLHIMSYCYNRTEDRTNILYRDKLLHHATMIVLAIAYGEPHAGLWFSLAVNKTGNHSYYFTEESLLTSALLSDKTNEIGNRWVLRLETQQQQLGIIAAIDKYGCVVGSAAYLAHDSPLFAGFLGRHSSNDTFETSELVGLDQPVSVTAVARIIPHVGWEPSPKSYYGLPRRREPIQFSVSDPYNENTIQQRFKGWRVILRKIIAIQLPDGIQHSRGGVGLMLPRQTYVLALQFKFSSPQRDADAAAVSESDEMDTTSHDERDEKLADIMRQQKHAREVVPRNEIAIHLRGIFPLYLPYTEEFIAHRGGVNTFRPPYSPFNPSVRAFVWETFKADDIIEFVFRNSLASERNMQRLAVAPSLGPSVGAPVVAQSQMRTMMDILNFVSRDLAKVNAFCVENGVQLFFADWFTWLARYSHALAIDPKEIKLTLSGLIMMAKRLKMGGYYPLAETSEWTCTKLIRMLDAYVRKFILKKKQDIRKVSSPKPSDDSVEAILLSHWDDFPLVKLIAHWINRTDIEATVKRIMITLRAVVDVSGASFSSSFVNRVREYITTFNDDQATNIVWRTDVLPGQESNPSTPTNSGQDSPERDLYANAHEKKLVSTCGHWVDTMEKLMTSMNSLANKLGFSDVRITNFLNLVDIHIDPFIPAWRTLGALKTHAMSMDTAQEENILTHIVQAFSGCLDGSAFANAFTKVIRAKPDLFRRLGLIESVAPRISTTDPTAGTTTPVQPSPASDPMVLDDLDAEALRASIKKLARKAAQYGRRFSKIWHELLCQSTPGYAPPVWFTVFPYPPQLFHMMDRLEMRNTGGFTDPLVEPHRELWSRLDNDGRNRVIRAAIENKRPAQQGAQLNPLIDLFEGVVTVHGDRKATQRTFHATRQQIAAWLNPTNRLLVFGLVNAKPAIKAKAEEFYRNATQLRPYLVGMTPSDPLMPTAHDILATDEETLVARMPHVSDAIYAACLCYQLGVSADARDDPTVFSLQASNRPGTLSLMMALQSHSAQHVFDILAYYNMVATQLNQSLANTELPGFTHQTNERLLPLRILTLYELKQTWRLGDATVFDIASSTTSSSNDKALAHKTINEYIFSQILTAVDGSRDAAQTTIQGLNTLTLPSPTSVSRVAADIAVYLSQPSKVKNVQMDATIIKALQDSEQVAQIAYIQSNISSESSVPKMWPKSLHDIMVDAHKLTRKWAREKRAAWAEVFRMPPINSPKDQEAFHKEDALLARLLYEATLTANNCESMSHLDLARLAAMCSDATDILAKSIERFNRVEERLSIPRAPSTLSESSADALNQLSLLTAARSSAQRTSLASMASLIPQGIEQLSLSVDTTQTPRPTRFESDDMDVDKPTTPTSRPPATPPFGRPHDSGFDDASSSSPSSSPPKKPAQKQAPPKKITTDEDVEMVDAFQSPPQEGGDADELLELTQLPKDTTLPSPLDYTADTRAALSPEQMQLLKKALTISQPERRYRYQNALQGLAATAGPLVAVALAMKRFKSFLAWLDDGKDATRLSDPWLPLEPRFLPKDLNSDDATRDVTFLQAYMSKGNSFWLEFDWAARVLAPLELLSHTARTVHQWIESVLVFPEFDLVLSTFDIHRYTYDMAAKHGLPLNQRETELNLKIANTKVDKPETQTWLKQPVYWDYANDASRLEARWKTSDALITPNLLEQVRETLKAYDTTFASEATAHGSRLILGRMIERRNWSELDLTVDVLAVADPIPDNLPGMRSLQKTAITVTSNHIVETLWMSQFDTPENVARLLGMLTLSRQSNNALFLLFRHMIDRAFETFAEKRDFVPGRVFDRHTSTLLANIIKAHTRPTREPETINLFDVTGKQRWNHPLTKASIVQNRSEEVQVLAFILFGAYPAANQADAFLAQLWEMKRSYQEQLRNYQQSALVLDADH